MRIVVRAPLLSVSGYGQHSRQVFEAAKQIPDCNVFTQIVQWGNTSWIIDSESECKESECKKSECKESECKEK